MLVSKAIQTRESIQNKTSQTRPQRCNSTTKNTPTTNTRAHTGASAARVAALHRDGVNLVQKQNAWAVDARAMKGVSGGRTGGWQRCRTDKSCDKERKIETNIFHNDLANTENVLLIVEPKRSYVCVCQKGDALLKKGDALLSTRYFSWAMIPLSK